MFDQDPTLWCREGVAIAVLAAYTWSFLQFALVFTATAETVPDIKSLPKVRHFRFVLVSIKKIHAFKSSTWSLFAYSIPAEETSKIRPEKKYSLLMTDWLLLARENSKPSNSHSETLHGSLQSLSAELRQFMRIEVSCNLVPRVSLLPAKS